MSALADGIVAEGARELNFTVEVRDELSPASPLLLFPVSEQKFLFARSCINLERQMVTTARAFLVGAGTTFIIGGMAFGGGLIFAKTLMEPAPVAPRHLAASHLPPARVVLPTLVEAAAQPDPGALAPPAPEPVAAPEPHPTEAVQGEGGEAAPEKDRVTERTEHRKAEAEFREHRKRVAERKAKAARIAKLQQRRQQKGDEPRIVAFDGGDDVQSRTNSSFFGN